MRKDKLDRADVRALIRNVCDVAGSHTLMDDARVGLGAVGVIDAIQRHDDAVIFEWLLNVLQFQGISDAAARRFIEDHGQVRAKDIVKGLSKNPPCPKLKGYYSFYDCGYRKAQRRCQEPELLESCPLPHHDMRNGSLNQLAYALFFFMRDVAAGDFVGWIDRQLIKAGGRRVARPCSANSDPVSDALAQVHGIGPKVARLAMATLLLGGDAERRDWIAAGAAMIVVDTLTHNWLHRTGILKAMDAEHLYGDRCYGPDGCAVLIGRLAKLVDARRYNPDYPRYFPRFVQSAIWTFCSADGLNVCNGLQVDDHRRCQRKDCDLYSGCARQRLHRPVAAQTKLTLSEQA